jgi:phage pi2 protein 07
VLRGGCTRCALEGIDGGSAQTCKNPHDESRNRFPKTNEQTATKGESKQPMGQKEKNICDARIENIFSCRPVSPAIVLDETGWRRYKGEYKIQRVFYFSKMLMFLEVHFDILSCCVLWNRSRSICAAVSKNARPWGDKCFHRSAIVCVSLRRQTDATRR